MDMFKHSDKVFVAEDNRNYIGELPHHLAHKGVPRDVSRTGFFKLVGREGSTLQFKTGMKYLTPCQGKVLTNPKTGEEIWSYSYPSPGSVMFPGSRSVPTLDGKVKFTIHEGTQPGDEFKLRGKGIQRLNYSGKGDQYVKIIVENNVFRAGCNSRPAVKSASVFR